MTGGADLEKLRPWFEGQYVEGHDALTNLDEVEQEAREALSGSQW